MGHKHSSGHGELATTYVVPSFASRVAVARAPKKQTVVEFRLATAGARLLRGAFDL